MNEESWIVDCSSQRPLPSLRSHVEWIKHEGVDVHWWILHDPISNQYYRCEHFEATVLQNLNGELTHAALFNRLLAEFPSHECTEQRFQEALKFAYAKQLLNLPGKRKHRENSTQHEVSRDQVVHLHGLRRSLSSLIYQKIPLGNPNRPAQWLADHSDWLFKPSAVQFWLGFLVVTMAMTLLELNRVNGEALQSAWQFSAIQDWSLWTGYIVVFIVTRVFHEAAHACVCARHNANCTEFGIMRILCIAFPYVDVTDAWRIPDKKSRVAVYAAGVYVEAIIAAFALWIWKFSAVDYIQNIAMGTAVICSLASLLFNGNPLMKYDGYYILSDWLELADLQKAARRSWRDIFVRYLPLSPSKKNNKTMHRPIWQHVSLLIYAPVAYIYRLSIAASMLVGILVTLHAWDLTELGWALASLVVVLGTATSIDTKIRTQIIISKPADLHSRNRSVPLWITQCLIWGLATLTLAVLTTLPIPERIHSYGKVVSESRMPAFVSSPSTVLKSITAELHPRIELDRTEADREINRVYQSVEELKSKSQSIQKAAYYDTKLLEQLPQLQTLQALREKRLQILQQQASMYSLSAREGQTFLAAGMNSSFKDGPSPASSREMLQIRYPTITNANALGMRAEQGMLLGYFVAEDRKPVIEASISQEARPLAYVGQPANVRLSQAPSLVFRASIKSISQLIQPTDLEASAQAPEVDSTLSRPHYLIQLSLADENLMPNFVEDGQAEVVLIARGSSLLSRSMDYLWKLTR